MSALTSPSPNVARRTAVVVALLFAVSSVISMASPAPTLAWNSGSFSAGSEADLVTLTNRSRAAAGLKALKVSSTLTSVARWRSEDMISRDYFSHDIPGYGSVFKKLDAKDYCYKVAGENIGWNTYPDETATAGIHDMFMKSTSHRANILGKSWDVIGVGAYKGPDGKKMWTVLFADRAGCTTTATATPKATPKPTPKPTATPTPTPTPPIATQQRRAEPSFDDWRGNGIGPGGQDSGNGKGGQNGDGGSSGNGTPPGQAGAPSAATATGLRITTAATGAGLLESIVGGVTGLFFGI